MEYILENKRKSVFKLLKPLFVVYENKGMKDMVKKVFDPILWLLEEMQKLVKALRNQEK